MRYGRAMTAPAIDAATTALPTRDGVPARVLLASDLSARCDRALDRAAQLAGAWGSELHVISVVEGPRSPDQALAWAWRGDDEAALRHARRELHADVAPLGVRGVLVVVHGDAAQRIVEHAEQARCGLVVVGMARSETFGRFLLGGTVARLARTLASPLLVVRRRVRGPYRRVVVATDFSESSRHALDAAARCFAQVELGLYHALPARGLGAVEAPVDDETRRRIEDGEARAFVGASSLDAARRDGLRLSVGRGALDSLLAQHVRDHDVDLVVIGTQGRSGLLGALLGSSAERVLDRLPCDTMVVRAPGGASG